MAYYTGTTGMSGKRPTPPPPMFFAQAQQQYDPFAGIDFNALRAQFAPKTGQDIMAEMNAAHSMLPAELQLGAARVDPGAIAEARERYRQDVVRPSVEKLKADMAAEGRDNSTFGGAALAMMQAQGEKDSYYAGEDLVDRALNRWNAKRGSYFGTRQGEGGLSTNDNGGQTLASFLLGGINAQTNAQNSELDRYIKLNDFNKKNGFMGQYGNVLGGLARGAINQAPNIWNWFKGHMPQGGAGSAPRTAPVGPSLASGNGAPAQPFGRSSWSFDEDA